MHRVPAAAGLQRSLPGPRLMLSKPKFSTFPSCQFQAALLGEMRGPSPLPELCVQVGIPSDGGSLGSWGGELWSHSPAPSVSQLSKQETDREFLLIWKAGRSKPNILIGSIDNFTSWVHFCTPFFTAGHALSYRPFPKLHPVTVKMRFVILLRRLVSSHPFPFPSPIMPLHC